jgi:hypothetical protein
MALAGRAVSEARWDEALASALKARGRESEDQETVARFIHEARMARGEAEALADEYRAAVAANPMDFGSTRFLTDALAASGREAEIEPAVNAWIARLPAPVQPQLAPPLRAMGLYDAGKLEECATFCASNPLLKGSPHRLHALVALGRTKEAADDPAFEPLWDNLLSLLAVSVGFGLDGDLEASARWRDKAVAVMKKDGGANDLDGTAKLLTAAEPPAIVEARRFDAPLTHKALILAAFGDRFPDDRESYLAEAARFNVGRGPSYHLIKRAVEAGTETEAEASARP